MQTDFCPCGSTLPYTDCCGIFHSGKALAPSAEALMRSRYCAFCKQNTEYLVATLHPSRRSPDEPALIRRSFSDVVWQELVILDREKGQPGDDAGTVEFIARYEVAGKSQFLRERSRFVLEQKQWYYTTGEIIAAPNPGRNDSCWCGSGKKFKKCHG